MRISDRPNPSLIKNKMENAQPIGAALSILFLFPKPHTPKARQKRVSGVVTMEWVNTMTQSSVVSNT